MLKIADREIYIGEDLFPEIAHYCLKIDKRPLVVVDAALKGLYGDQLASLLQCDLLTIPNGEKGKKQSTVDALIEEMLVRGFGRDSILIALGGGVTTDLVGFVASVYMRGIDLILVPTSLLAMVDAAIGGKTGVNTPFGKNLIGTIYQPKSIFISLKTLTTLPEKETFNGLSEMIKTGIIYDASLLFCRGKEQIVKAIEAKLSIVEKDPKENSLRRILNFGHTIGHALESCSDYAITHGEAVAIGSMTEAHLSFCLGYLGESELQKIGALYTRFTLNLPRLYERERFLNALSFDKKSEKGKMRFVCLDQIGSPLSFGGDYCRTVSREELEKSLTWMESRFG
jgi:3-dehydroquinate synthase